MDLVYKTFQPNSDELPHHVLTMYCLIASILFWNSALAAFMLVIMAPMLPTMEAKMSTPTRKSKVTKIYLKWRKDNS